MKNDRLTFILLFSTFLNIILAVLVGYFYFYNIELSTPVPLSEQEETEMPLNKYAYDALKQEVFTPQTMKFGDIIGENEDFETRMFYYEVDGRKVSGLAHLPIEKGEYPVIVMIRGFVDRDIYAPGVGTRRAAEVFARNGYITLAPDFLGYGESDQASAVPLEDRFQTYPTVLQLLANIEKLDDSFESSNVSLQSNENNIGIWGHSNGGQISLTVLEVTGKDYPTVLWAPVTKPFPYSVLYFTDEFEDHGRYLRRVIAQFEEVYDIHRFSLSNYIDWITAPIQLHQGGADDAVPLEWSDEFIELAEKDDIEIEYFVYPAADHNLMPDWNTAVQRSQAFFDGHLK